MDKKRQKELVDALYQTKLPLLEEIKYRYAKFNSPYRNDNGQGNYDYRGYYQKYGTLNPNSPNMHLTDEFKTPNHITYSNESKFNTPNNQGGVWNRLPDGSYSFTPSAFNLQLHSPLEYKEYFEKYEPGNQVILPEGY